MRGRLRRRVCGSTAKESFDLIAEASTKMQPRNLIVLGIVLVVLVLCAHFTGRQPVREAPGGLMSGTRLFPIDDFNKVAGISIGDGMQRVDLVKTSGKWSVASSWNYPADFDKIADELNRYDQMRVGEAMRASTEDLKAFGLDSSATGGTTGPAIVTLRDAGNRELCVFKIGKERNRPASGGKGGFADGQYVRIGDGPVVLVDQNAGKPGSRGKDWINTQLLQIAAEQIMDIEIIDRDGKSYGLVRDTNMTVHAKEKTNTEELKDEGVKNVLGAINYLGFNDLAGPTGSVHNAFSSSNSMYCAKTRDGVIYRLDLGGTAGPAMRYAHLTVGFEQPPPPVFGPSANTNATGTNAVAEMKVYEEKTAKDKKTAGELNALHSPWIYLLDESSAMNLMLSREQVIAIPPPTNTVPSASGSQGMDKYSRLDSNK